MMRAQYLPARLFVLLDHAAMCKRTDIVMIYPVCLPGNTGPERHRGMSSGHYDYSSQS